MILSLAILLMLGFILGKLFSYLKIPNVLGMLLAGIIMGPYILNFLSSDLLNISQEIRSLALIIILLKAGLGLKIKVLKKVGPVSLKLGLLPCVFEGAAVLIMGIWLLNFSLAEAGMLGFILAAVSPAIVIPGILDLKKKGYGEDKNISTILLAGTSLDDVFAITIFTVFLGLGIGGSVNVFYEMGKIPINIILGTIGGFVLGFVISKIYMNKGIILNNLEKLLILLTLAYIYYKFGEYIGIASLLGVMTMGIVILDKCVETAKKTSINLTKVWFFAQIALFTLVGAEVNISIVLESGFFGVAIILIGLIARSLGVWVATLGTNLNYKEKLFCIVAYLPKATVQAAIGAIPLASGVEGGEVILAIAVLAILITAPIGAFGIKLGAPKLLNKVKLMDN